MATTQVEIVVPDGLGPGDAFDVEWGGVNYNIAVPDGCAGGTALNIVPDICVFDCEFRVLPFEDADALVDELRDYARELEAAMQRIAPEAGIEIDLYAQFPGLDTSPDAPVVTLAKSLTGSNGHSKVAFGTEGGRFDQMLGVLTQNAVREQQARIEIARLEKEIACKNLNLQERCLLRMKVCETGRLTKPKILLFQTLNQ